jgi:membrane protein DedA with SNARE-associated domain
MTKWIMDLIAATGYFGIVLLMIVENVFPPIPSEYIMPLAGFMVSKDEFTLVGIIAAGTLGSVLGAVPLYYLGNYVGEEGMKNFAEKYCRWLTISPDDIERANGWFDKYGVFAVLFCRLIPGLRSLISVPAGINGMNIFTFLFFTAIGTAVWTSILAYAGYYLGSNFRQIEGYLDIITYIVFGSIIALYLWRVFKK